MTISTYEEISSRLDFLICSLFVLVPTDELFKKLNLRTDMCLTIKGRNYILQNWGELKVLVNDELIRQYSFTLI